LVDIKQLANKYYEQYASIREYLHQYPEESNEEYETCKYIQEQLDKMGIENHVLAKTGVVGLIRGGKPGKTVILRGDIDALLVEEEADVAYKSKKPGLMHACGHDGHTAGLFGAAMILNEIKDQLHGNVKLMFQPAEESLGGAQRMIDEGILENPKVDAAFGLHLWGPTPYGQVQYRDGAMMAASDRFTAKIIGKGCHAAMPHLGIDPIVLASNAVSDLQNIVSRRVNPLEPAVMSICSFHGGTSYNVIPQEVELKGTIRSLSNEVRADIPKWIEEYLKGQAIQYGNTYEWDYIYRYPPVINHKETNLVARKAFAKIVGEENVTELAEPNMGGEDFACLGQVIPASYLFVGIHKEGEPAPVHHHPEFGFDTKILEISSAGLAQIAYDFLNEGE